MANYKQGFFKPKHPQKYHGNPTMIVYRSSYELKFMMQLDHDPNVLKWGSEEIRVGYISPKDGRPHIYYPDFFYKTMTENIMVEIKPMSQCIQPTMTSKTTKRRFLNESVTYAINQAKWAAAEKYCQKKGWKFKIMTEKDLGIPTYG